MIQIHNLSKKYGDTVIFENICCLLENHHIYGLTGSNGAGKSTLLNAIAQPGSKDHGTVRIDGIDSRIFKSRFHFFYIPDDREMFLNLSGREYLSFIVKIYHQEEKKSNETLRKLSHAFGLEQSLHERIDNYSSGMRQKVFLIASFLSGAGNLILDEPFNGLDPESATALKEILAAYRNAGNLALLSLHNRDLIADLCDDVIYIDKQRNISHFTGADTAVHSQCQ